MRLPVIQEYRDEFMILVDFADHEFEEIGEVGLVLLLSEQFSITDEALLTDLQQKVYQLFLFFECFQQKLQQAEGTAE